MIDIRAVVRAVADTYDTEATARAALINMGFPAAKIPTWDRPELFWSSVIQDLLRGRMKDGIGLLVAGALEEYPASRQLQDLMSSITEHRLDAEPLLVETPQAASHRRISLGGGMAGEESFAITDGADERGRQISPSGSAVLLAPRRWPIRIFRRKRDASQISLRNLRSVEFPSATRRLEPIGTDQYDFDNSASSATSIETLRIFHSTQFILVFDIDHAVLRSGQSSVGIMDFARIQGRLQSSVMSHLSLTEQTTLTVERTSQINIPANAHVRVALQWKRVWQDGIVALRTRSGFDVEIPYSVTTDLVFDKTLTDITP
jgi:hypothetical protein